MKVIAELELHGDFGGDLTKEEIQDIINEVFQSGAESCSCDGKATVTIIIEE